MTSPIAREAAELILGNALLPREKARMDLLMEPMTQVIQSALQSHVAQAIKESGAIEALETCQYSRCGSKTMQSYNPVAIANAVSRLRALSGEG